MLLPMSAFGQGGIYHEGTEFFTEQPDYLNERLNALNNIMVAAARAVKAGRAINPAFHFGTMICLITQYPRTCCPEDQLSIFVDWKLLMLHKRILLYNHSSLSSSRHYILWRIRFQNP